MSQRRTNKIDRNNWMQSIQKRNDAFKRLSKTGKVMELVCDAAFQHIIGVTQPRTGNGFVRDMDTDNVLRKGNDDVEEFQLQPLIPIVNCVVCMKGGLLLSAISFKNKMKIEETVGVALGSGGGDVRRTMIPEISASEFDYLENCFEDGNQYQQDFNLGSADDETLYLHILARIAQFGGDIAKMRGSTKDLNPKNLIELVDKKYFLTAKELSQLKKNLSKHLKYEVLEEQD